MGQPRQERSLIVPGDESCGGCEWWTSVSFAHHLFFLANLVEFYCRGLLSIHSCEDQSIESVKLSRGKVGQPFM